MARFNKEKGSYSRSIDFPDIDDYPVSDLREACELYRALKRTKNNVTAMDIQTHFRCTPHKARMLLGAAEFYEKMRKEGKA